MQRARPLPQENVQGVLRLGEARLEAGDLRQRLFAVAARLLHILGADETGLSAELRELERLGLTCEVGAGDAEADLEGPDLDVVPRHFGDQRDSGIVEAGHRRFLVGLGRLDAAAHAPEHVQLPARVEADTELVARDGSRATAGGTGEARTSARLGAARGARCLHGGVAPGACHREAGARFTQSGARLAQVQALLLRLSTSSDSSGSSKPRHHWLRSPRALPVATGVLVASSPAPRCRCARLRLW